MGLKVFANEQCQGVSCMSPGSVPASDCPAPSSRLPGLSQLLQSWSCPMQQVPGSWHGTLAWDPHGIAPDIISTVRENKTQVF